MRDTHGRGGDEKRKRGEKRGRKKGAKRRVLKMTWCAGLGAIHARPGQAWRSYDDNGMVIREREGVTNNKYSTCTNPNMKNTWATSIYGSSKSKHREYYLTGHMNA